MPGELSTSGEHEEYRGPKRKHKRMRELFGRLASQSSQGGEVSATAVEPELSPTLQDVEDGLSVALREHLGDAIVRAHAFIRAVKAGEIPVQLERELDASRLNREDVDRVVHAWADRYAEPYGIFRKNVARIDEPGTYFDDTNAMIFCHTVQQSEESLSAFVRHSLGA